MYVFSYELVVVDENCCYSLMRAWGLQHTSLDPNPPSCGMSNAIQYVERSTVGVRLAFGA